MFAPCFKLECFFFSSRRRHTRWNCDWSSDVCSSDLPRHAAAAQRTPEIRRAATPAPGPGPARATPAPPPRGPQEKPVRHLSWDELRQLTGASEDELDIPTFLRNGE